MSHASSSGRFSLIQPLETRTLFSTFPPVIAPRGLTVHADTATSATLQWIDQSVNETGFQIERRVGSSGAFQIVIITGPNDTSYTDDGLDPETQYTYRIRANANVADSDYAPSATIVTPPTSFADRDANDILFIHANTGVDVVFITDNQDNDSIDVNVNGQLASFDKTLEPIAGYSLITANNDHSLTIDANGAATLKGNAQANDIVGLSGDETVTNFKINGSVTIVSKTLLRRISVLTFIGDDRISVSPAVGAVNVSGGDGNDTILAGTGDDSLDGGNGNDLIKGNDGNDSILGGAGNDTLYGQNGDDTLVGNDGNDKLEGGDGVDSILGNDGNDRLYGGVGQDILKGGHGQDVVVQG